MCIYSDAYLDVSFCSQSAGLKQGLCEEDATLIHIHPCLMFVHARVCVCVSVHVYVYVCAYVYVYVHVTVYVFLFV